MATYKVLQDIEADDKLVGPLTARQFIYAGISALNLYLCFLVITKGFAFMLIFFFPLAAITAFFAWPWGGQQPTEVWALAKVRYFLKPRVRIWDQAGIKELVTITAPKKVERILTNNLSQDEIRNRLSILANTIDSRGWAIKNVGAGVAAMQPVAPFDPGSDRLIAPSTLPQPVTSSEVSDSDDMLDIKNNRVAQQFDRMITESTKAHRQQVIDRMKQVDMPAPPPAAQPVIAAGQQTANDNRWFLNQPSQTASSIPQNNVTFNTQVVTPGTPTSSLPVAAAVPTADEEAFIKSHKNEPVFSPNMHGHLHVIQPLSAQKAAPMPPSFSGAATQTNLPSQPPTTVVPAGGASITAPQPAKVTQPPDTAILDLARNDDLNVATIAREANKRMESSQDEVVISLH